MSSMKLIRDIHRSFKSLQAVVFSDHNEFCAMLHAAISSELGLEVEALRCTTAPHFGEERFAWQYCMISQQPLSIRYEVKLNLNMKPIRLRPDVCSLLFYARNSADLSPYMLGSGPPASDVDKLAAA
ncbi:MAG: hypothetical protein R3F65_05840 [bacterium]